MDLIINTLGPKQTDCYRATMYWLKKHGISDYKVKLHESIENLFTNLIQGEYIMMPAGYVNRKDNLSTWVDFHFSFYETLELIDVFANNVMIMALIENNKYTKKGIVVQSATCNLIRNKTEEFVYADSKPKALEKFINESYHYVICSKSMFKEKSLDVSQYVIKEEYKPTMVWVVYRINQENTNEKN